MLPVFSWICQSDLAYSNPQIRAPTGPKNPEIMNIKVFGFSDTLWPDTMPTNRFVFFRHPPSQVRHPE